MEMKESSGFGSNSVTITGRNKAGGISVAHLFSSSKTEQALVDTFFCSPTNWKGETNKQEQALVDYLPEFEI